MPGGSLSYILATFEVKDKIDSIILLLSLSIYAPELQVSAYRPWCLVTNVTHDFHNA